MKTVSRAAESLALVPPLRDPDWDFCGEPASRGLHGIHPYPAMMHPGIARRLIEQFSDSGDMILDPFLGSGVVGVEALRLGRRFVGYDINPLAICISKVRATYIRPPRLKMLLANILRRFRQSRSMVVSVPPVRNMDYWFHPEVQRGLYRLLRAIELYTRGKERDFFYVAFSETVRVVSATRGNEFKLFRRDDWESYHPSVIDIFQKIVLENILRMEQDGFCNSAPQVPTFELRDVRKTLPLHKASVSLVVTSPPYGDSKTTVAYGQFSRLSLEWLGIRENVDKESLGGERQNVLFADLPSESLRAAFREVHRQSVERHQDVCLFYAELRKAVRNIASVIRLYGHACFVVGNRRVAGVEMPTDIAVADFFLQEGFLHQATFVRNLSNKRMPLENSPSNVVGEKDTTMRHEYIVVCKKERVNAG